MDSKIVHYFDPDQRNSPKMGYGAWMLLRISCLIFLASSPFLYGEDIQIEDPGFVVFRDRCMPCHLQTGMGIREMNAPSIAGLPRWYISDQLRKFRRDQRGFHEEDESGHLMQANAAALDERSIAFVGRYIENLNANLSRNTLDNLPADLGWKLYAEDCASCHGDAAEGNRSLRIPPLTFQQDWYLLRQMDNFESEKRIHHEEDQKPLEEAELQAVVAWISKIQPKP